MTPDQSTRLTHLLAMTTSPHDGEALNACRLAWKYMKELGINFQDVVDGAAVPQGQEARTKAFQEGYDAGYAKGYREGQRAPRARPGSWQALVRDLLDQSDDLTEWEEKFLDGFQARGWHTPTERQRAVFERIAGKFGLDLPDDGPGAPPAWVGNHGEFR